MCSFCLLPFFDAIKSSSLELDEGLFFLFFGNFETEYARTKVVSFPSGFPRMKVEFPCAEWIFSTLIMSTHAISMGSKLVMVKRFSRVDTHDSLLSRMLWGLSHVLYYLKFRFTDFAS